jgi:hypothetical protein
MFCSRCAGQIDSHTLTCSACGAPVSPVDGTEGMQRPGIITVFAVLQFIGATIWILGALITVAVGLSRPGQAEGQTGVVLVALLFAAVGVAQVVCGAGLLQMKPHGRTVLLAFAWIGLIGIPIGTIISILILVYMYKPGIKALFSGRPFSEFSPDELAQISAVTRSSTATTVVVVVLVGVLMLAMVGIVAAIAIPGLLRARMAGNASRNQQRSGDVCGELCGGRLCRLSCGSCQAAGQGRGRVYQSRARDKRRGEERLSRDACQGRDGRGRRRAPGQRDL